MTRAAPSTPWRLAVAVAGLILAAALAPAVLPPPAADAVRSAFAWLCHQIPERTLHLGGAPVALCHRCLGVLLGMGLGLCLAPAAPRRVRGWTSAEAQARVLLAAGLPLAADWLLGATGLWANTAGSRSLTGAVFGVAAGGLIGVSLRARRRGGPGHAVPTPRRTPPQETAERLPISERPSRGAWR